jgi:tetratricopeptide (TPR) repeat protein
MRTAVVLSLVFFAQSVLAQPEEFGFVPSPDLAEEYFRNYDYIDAALVYQHILWTDSTNFQVLTRLTEAWNLHGLDLQAAEKKDSAEVAFETAVKYAEQTRRHHPDSARTYVNLAAAWGNWALFQGGKTKVRIGRQVEEYGHEALRIDSTDVMALSILGVFHREVSRLSWIERLLAKAVYGGIPKGSIEKSEQYLKRAIAVDSAAVFPNYSLAVTYRRMKKKEEAAKQLEYVLTLEPANTEELRYLKNARTWLEEAERN